MALTEEPASSPRLVVLDISELKGHERTQPALLDRIREEIRRDRCLRNPILVADGHLVILDGHHRFEALRQLGCRRIPAYVVDYGSDAVRVDVWPDATVRAVTKDEVIRRGVIGDLFPPKTSRHRVLVILDERPTALEDLM